MTALVLGPALLAAGTVMVVQGGALLGLAGALLVVADVLAVAYLLRFLGTPRGAPRVLERDGATVLPESWAAQLTAWGSVAAALAFLLALVAASLVDAVGGPGLGLAAAVAVLVLAVPTIAGVVHRRIRPGALALSPASITLSSWNADRTLAWDDVAEVVLLGSPRRTLVVYAREESQVRLGRRSSGLGEQQARAVPDAARSLAMSFTHLDGDPATLAAALEHWCRSAAARAELGTADARRRLTPRH